VRGNVPRGDNDSWFGCVLLFPGDSMRTSITPLAAALVAAMIGSETTAAQDKSPKKDGPPAAVRSTPLVAVKDAPTVQMLVPGFTIRELPVKLTNINNIAYAPDSRLFAAGYDGRIHLLRDTDGDGLEDSVTTFHDKKSDDYPLGIAFHDGALYVCRRHHVARHFDADSDGVPRKEDIAATGWRDPEIDKDKLMQHRRVDDALGLAVAVDGTIYVSIGSANYSNGYLVDKSGKAQFGVTQPRGVVLKISPDGKKREAIATGVRFLTSMTFNRHGDLFAADQEGATWLPNGNPFDELLHIQTGRHYGFPPRHPKFLPDVIDEPSVFDYGPQHQSVCGFRFNEPPADGKCFGPAHWAHDAILTGESRGKLFRTRTVKTPAGYVAQNQVIGTLGMLPVDVAISPGGDLVVACHSGPPDWGTGPAGIGKLFKISYARTDEPMPVLAWAASPTETVVEFDRPLDPARWKNLTQSRVEGGLYVSAGDRFERFRPGYEVVKAQMATPRYDYSVLSAGLGSDGRSILLRTAPRTDGYRYSVTLPYPEQAGKTGVVRSAGIDLPLDLTGVEASWRSADGKTTWTGWLPHVDWSVSQELTAGSATHAALRESARKPGMLTLRGQLDLWSMLHPAVQVGAKLGFEYPPETVTVVFRSSGQLKLVADPAKVESEAGAVKLTVTPEKNRWLPFALTTTNADMPLSLSVSWFTNEDARPRALPLHRILLPWAIVPRNQPTDIVRKIPEIAGGDWAAGKKVFFGEKANCAKCHTVRGEGAQIGPDLSNLVFRDYESVLRDIREPSAAINPDYLSYAIELADGKTLTGVLNGSDDKTVRVADLTGKISEVARKQVTSMSPSRTSIMPERLLDGLTDGQRRDLLTFLLMAP
jgi:putative heme-binding domain-containing protein